MDTGRRAREKSASRIRCGIVAGLIGMLTLDGVHSAFFINDGCLIALRGPCTQMLSLTRRTTGLSAARITSIAFWTLKCIDRSAKRESINMTDKYRGRIKN